MFFLPGFLLLNLKSIMLFCYKYVRVLYIKLIQYDGDSFHLSKGRNVHGFIIKKR